MTNEELVSRIQAGERERLPELWEQTKRFVLMMARRLPERPGVELDDYTNAGYLAMAQAAETYQEQEAGFLTWLSLYLKTAFAEAGGWRTEKQKRDPLNGALSLDAPLNDEDDGTLADLTPDKDALTPFEAAEERIFQEQLHAALEAAMSPIEDAEIVRARYYQGQTFREIGASVGCTESRAAARCDAVIREIRRRANTEAGAALRAFVEERTPYYLHVGVETFNRTGESAVERLVFLREDIYTRKA